MKYVKMLGLAAIAAMALMAFAGAGSASATVLCTTQESPCKAGWDEPSGTTVDASLASGASATLSATGGALEDTCTESTVKGTTSTTGGKGKAVTGTVANLTFNKCSKPTKVLEETGGLEVNWTSGNNGTLFASGFKVTVEAVSGVSCVYSAGTSTELGTVTGGNPATVTLNAVVNKKEGSFLCPSDSRWTGTYTITEPKPLYLASE